MFRCVEPGGSPNEYNYWHYLLHGDTLLDAACLSLSLSLERVCFYNGSINNAIRVIEFKVDRPY